MAMVSGRRSTLNPDAPLFIPAAVRQVEDFSPEWWQLVTTSTWYHDYWISQHQGADGFYDNGENENGGGHQVDVADLLPESFDFDDMEDFFDNDASAEFDQGFDGQMYYQAQPSEFGLGKNGEMIRKSTGNRSPRSYVEPAKYAEKPAKWGNQRVAAAPRNIHQPR
ncbi:PREDICTED: protein EARLY RESPONSIVE TO DEHYDRATION 15 [Camelina sativa]|uniref:Protein EARLY RESPONSIVE TO DEHYDRATION 15 n=1 Tax=Camelina sativa TaxID=90675 RepID=A0ABM0YU59_CAMSA|nr:PREDICTED: protein EARLY RESPONSIVE TO DEHYDRATION 15 [Camelina sativa]XP_010505924.1 PREDICTED: protein EARLY RESPONSIVE TO DEHYDRATION 15 [Camelina sativa]